MVEYERCPHCKKALEITVQIKDGAEFGESLIRLTEFNLKNTRDNLINSGLVSKEELF